MRINHIMAVLGFCTLVSCQKKIELRSLSFDVKSDSAAYTLKTIPSTGNYAIVNFSFTGNPDIISFYSGDVGRRYAFKDRDTASGTPKLNFTTQRNTGTQANTLGLFIS